MNIEDINNQIKEYEKQFTPQQKNRMYFRVLNYLKTGETFQYGPENNKVPVYFIKKDNTYYLAIDTEGIVPPEIECKYYLIRASDSTNSRTIENFAKEFYKKMLHLIGYNFDKILSRSLNHFDEYINMDKM
jgi:hypothetical protein